MMDYMLMPFRRYFDFRGRSRRLEFWMFVLLNMVVGFVLSIIFLSLFLGRIIELAREHGYRSPQTYGSGGFDGQAGATIGIPPAMLFEALGPLGLAFFSATLVWSLFIFIPGLAVSVRRLHDIDRSGWWIAGPYLINLLVLVSATPSLTSPDLLAPVLALGGLLGLVSFIVSIVLLVFLLLPGTRGPNRFGPDPKALDGERAFT